MENDYFKAIVSVVLPAQILDYFIVVGVEQTKTEIHISLDECNNKDLSEDIHFESKGFMEPVNVTDFPIRDHKVILRKRLLWEMKLIDWPKYSSVLSKRSVDSKQKNRRCSAKESTMLRESSQYTLRYHLTAIDREVVILDKKILHLAIHIVWRVNVICICRKPGIARKTAGLTL